MPVQAELMREIVERKVAGSVEKSYPLGDERLVDLPPAEALETPVEIEDGGGHSFVLLAQRLEKVDTGAQ
jgi:hypothetical protein